MNFVEGANYTLWLDRPCRLDRPTARLPDRPTALSATTRYKLPALTDTDDGYEVKEKAKSLSER